MIALAIVAAGCGSSTGGSGASPSSGGAIKMGGVLKVGAQAGNGNFDPVLFAGAVGDIQLQSQIYEKLVTLGQDYSVQPCLATKWSSPDGKVWTFTLQPDVKFSNGQPFTSADVVYTMGRLRAKTSPMADIYANVKSVTAPDPTTVVFTLAKVDSEFPASLTDYRDLMLCKSVANPAKNPVGTGPFMLKSISAEDRAILVKNPTTGARTRRATSCLTSTRSTTSTRPTSPARSPACRAARSNFVGGPRLEQAQRSAAAPRSRRSHTSTNYCFELQIRCDVGPGNNLKFRQALLMGTDLPGIVALVAPGGATPGNGDARRPCVQERLPDHRRPSSTPAGAKAAAGPGGLSPTASASRSSPRPSTRSRPSSPPGRRR